MSDYLPFVGSYQEEPDCWLLTGKSGEIIQIGKSDAYLDSAGELQVSLNAALEKLIGLRRNNAITNPIDIKNVYVSNVADAAQYKCTLVEWDMDINCDWFKDCLTYIDGVITVYNKVTNLEAPYISRSLWIVPRKGTDPIPWDFHAEHPYLENKGLDPNKSSGGLAVRWRSNHRDSEVWALYTLHFSNGGIMSFRWFMFH